jgi:hypothetical protein
MDPQTILLITQLITVAGQGAVLTIEEILKLKALLVLNPEVEANIRKALDYSDAADDDTIARIDAWKAANGLA